MLALWTHVTLLRPFLSAKSNANRAMRSVFSLVVIFNDSITPGYDYQKQIVIMMIMIIVINTFIIVHILFVCKVPDVLVLNILPQYFHE